MSFDLKKRCLICDQLIQMSYIVDTRLSYELSDKSIIIDELKNNDDLSQLKFLKEYQLEREPSFKTILTKNDDKRINSFFNELGMSDVESQLKNVNSFREYFKLRQTQYLKDYEKNRKLYAAFGVSFGAIIVLMLS